MIPQVPLPNGPVLLDGGMGQELLARVGGSVGELWSAQVLLDKPKLVQEVHEDFIRAGARIITTNTYTAIRTKLDDAGMGFLFEDLNRRAGKLAVQARDSVGDADVLITGSLPPFYGSFRPDLVQAFDVIEPMYREQAEVLAPYVDFFLCETMSSAAEAVAAVAGAAPLGKPIWVAWTLEDHGSARLRSGETVAEAYAALDGLPVSGFLVNCCSPESVTAAMPALAAVGGQGNWPVGGFANGFAEIPDDWESGDGIETLGRRHDLDEAIYASHVKDWLDAGARLVGGCCEIGPGHIARLRRLLDERPAPGA